MRKTAITVLTTGLLTAAFAASALAGSLLSEPFAYPDGALAVVGGPAWTIHSGAGTDIAVTGGVAIGTMSNAPDDNRTFPARSTTDKTYACFLLRIPTQAPALVCNYFAHFMVNSTTFRSKVFVTPSGSSFTLGLSVTANAAGAPLAPPVAPLGATWPSPLNYDTWYTVTISYNAVGGVSELWINPADESSPKITATDATAASGGLTAFGLRQSNTGGAAFIYHVDNISVGTSFADACNGYPTSTVETTWGHLKTIYR